MPPQWVDAERQFEAALDDLTASVAANGTSLDINTEQGRANEKALDDLARAALDAAASKYELTGKEADATAAVQAGRDELIRQLNRLPGDSGADGWVSINGEFFVICRVRGRSVEVLLSDVTAANDWPIARDVVDYLGVELPDEDDEPAPLGDMEMYAASGLRAFELEAITTDHDEDSDELLGRIAERLKVGDEFERAAEAFDD